MVFEGCFMTEILSAGTLSSSNEVGEKKELTASETR